MGQISPFLRVAAAAAVAAVLLLAFQQKQYLAIAIVVAVACLFILATRLQWRTAAAVRTFKGLPVGLRIWGVPVCGEADLTFRLEKVQAFGAGLLIWVRSSAMEQAVFIKIAQPRDLRQEDDEVAIGRAKYVQVNKSTVPVVAGAPALHLWKIRSTP